MKVGVSIVPCIPGGLHQSPGSSLVPLHFFWRRRNELGKRLGLGVGKELGQACLLACSMAKLRVAQKGPCLLHTPQV